MVKEIKDKLETRGRKKDPNIRVRVSAQVPIPVRQLLEYDLKKTGLSASVSKILEKILLDHYSDRLFIVNGRYEAIISSTEIKA